MATDKGKCLVWIFHGGFHICTGLQLSIFCHLLEEINLGPERVISILFDAVTDGTWRRDEVPTCEAAVGKFTRVITAPWLF